MWSMVNFWFCHLPENVIQPSYLPPKRATLAGIQLASSGIGANFIVYLIQEFNIKSITAAQIANVVNGTTNLIPFLAAIIADSFFGSFPVALISSCVAFLGTVIFALTATIKSLRPGQCIIENGSRLCQSPSGVQYGVLYLGTTLGEIGSGGSRFTIASLGANQFDNPHHQATFFTWYLFILYSVSATGFTAIVYIQDNVSWVVGFWICVMSNFIAVVVFSVGYRYFRPDTPQGSALVALARVPVASFLKWNSKLSSRTQDYYHGDHHDEMVVPELATQRKTLLRFFNRAALITDGDSIEKPWRLCTAEQVEDFKKVIRILPLWTSTIFLSTPIGMLISLTTLQALVMDGQIGSHFKFPVGSLGVILQISTCILLSLLDRVLRPLYQKLTGKSITSLQLIGTGHVVNLLGANLHNYTCFEN